ncbi:lysine--tRNA ligase [Aurantimonas sp. MSK8Z-1]|uniref:lysine--tRNA ligase n=1 Tax=Mangrovibrevibacter kandeliae TaxID=2968473 RepID=UPI0021180E05|nr:lysine--tRNA ligase [Aurantimonas sp. MSK8Z-1]MCW4116069.1 lysine--tRNA ligase [Aurantimonas sp. MSK8Z-1]
MATDDTSPTLSSDPLEVRRQKLDRLIEMGIDPYPAHFHRTITNAAAAEAYADLANDTYSGDTVTVAGRVYSSRNSGMFIDLHDASGKLQIFSHKDTTPEAARVLLPLIDIGDIIGVTGKVRRTKRGELTVDADVITMLCKTLRPMPEKYHGLADVEQRYRRRYLDVMVNEESRERLRARSRILTGIRTFMAADGFMEVETPMLHPIYGGATAEPFVTHHNALDLDMYLRIAPELYLKRVLVSGLTDKVFEVNRNFRNEGLSTRHNPEFTMLEAYWAYADYEDVMDLVERLFGTLVKDLNAGSTPLAYGEHQIDFTGPFRRLPMPQAVLEATGIDFLAIDTDEAARAAATARGFEIDPTFTWGETLAFLFEETVEGTLIQPTHVTHFPKDISPFAKEMAEDRRLVERFETYCNAWEICNAFSELNDPVEQRRRITEQVEQAHARGETERKLDTDFLEAMDHGMPTAGGLGIGIDRLTMILTNARSIRDVILFPTLKPV